MKHMTLVRPLLERWGRTHLGGDGCPADNACSVGGHNDDRHWGLTSLDGAVGAFVIEITFKRIQVKVAVTGDDRWWNAICMDLGA